MSSTLLIATHSNLVTAGLSDDAGSVAARVVDTGYYYGIALIDDSTDSPPDVVVYRGGPSVHEQTQKEFVRYRQRAGALEQVDRRPIRGEVGAVHQLAYANGGVYLVNTAHNAVGFYGLDGECRHEYHFNAVSHDLNHVNSVFPCGRDIWVLLHNSRRTESEVAILRHDPARGFELIKTASLWHLMCHNVFVDAGQLLYCASSARSLVAVNLATQRIRRSVPFGEHTKGLAVCGDRVVLGMSDYAARSDRANSQGHLIVIDRASLRVLNKLRLRLEGTERGVGNINEIRTLGPLREEAQRALDGCGVSIPDLTLARGDALGYAWLKLKIGASKPFWAAKGRIRALKERLRGERRAA